MKKKLSLPTRILIALVLGVAVGILLDFVPPSFFRDRLLVDGLFLAAGKIFINAFRMMVVPIVFVSLTLGIAAMNSPQSLGRIGAKTIGFYLGTTVFAIVIGLAVAVIFSPGTGLDPARVGAAAEAAAPQMEQSMLDTLIDVVPQNPIRAFAGDSMLQIIFLAIVSGLALSMLGEKAPRLREILNELNLFNIRIIEMIMHFAPYGVFCLLARTFATLGATALLPLVKFLICIAFGMALQLFVVYGGMLKVLGRLNVRAFFRKFAPVMMVAFSTSSSNATLPTNIETLVKRMGVSERLATLLLSLGATINMDGTAIMQGCGAVFIAQLYGIELSVAQMATIVVTATLASIGTAGVPGVGVLMLAMVLQSVNLPMEGIAVIMGVDRLVDMMRTTVNISGDAVCACVIAVSERELDPAVYNNPAAGEESLQS